jgi:hypothetical protein
MSNPLFSDMTVFTSAIDAVASEEGLPIPSLMFNAERQATAAHILANVRVIVAPRDKNGKTIIETFHQAVDISVAGWQRDCAEAFRVWAKALVDELNKSPES